MIRQTQYDNGDCARLAYEFLLANRFKYSGQPVRLVVCHGFPRLTGGPHAGTITFHAWCELQAQGHAGYHSSVAIDVGSFAGDETVHAPVNAYYRGGRIDPRYVARYTFEQAAEQVLRHQTYGFWHEPDPRYEDPSEQSDPVTNRSEEAIP